MQMFFVSNYEASVIAVGFITGMTDIRPLVQLRYTLIS